MCTGQKKLNGFKKKKNRIQQTVAICYRFCACSKISNRFAQTWYPIQSHYPETELTSPCPILLMPSTWLESDKYLLILSYSVWFDLGYSACSQICPVSKRPGKHIVLMVVCADCIGIATSACQFCFWMHLSLEHLLRQFDKPLFWFNQEQIFTHEAWALAIRPLRPVYDLSVTRA